MYFLHQDPLDRKLEHSMDGLQGSYCLSKSKVNTSLIWSSATTNVSRFYLRMLQFCLADITLKCDVFWGRMMSNGSEMMAIAKEWKNLMSSGNNELVEYPGALLRAKIAKKDPHFAISNTSNSTVHSTQLAIEQQWYPQSNRHHKNSEDKWSTGLSKINRQSKEFLPVTNIFTTKKEGKKRVVFVGLCFRWFEIDLDSLTIRWATKHELQENHSDVDFSVMGISDWFFRASRTANSSSRDSTRKKRQSCVAEGFYRQQNNMHSMNNFTKV